MPRPLFNTIKLFILVFILHFLTACGGGSDEPSNLLVGTGGNVGGTAQPKEEESQDVSVLINHQLMLPAGGNSDVLLITYEKVADGQESNAPIEPGVTSNVTVTSPALINGKYTSLDFKTDQRGQASFNISHPGSGSVLINVRGTGRYKGGFTSIMYFGGSVTSTIVLKDSTNPIIPADGASNASLKVFVRDWAGVGIPNVPVDLSFSLNSFAVVVPSDLTTSNSSTSSSSSTSGTSSSIPTATDNNGEFVIGITNKVAQTVKVTPIAGGMSSAPVSLTFGATSIITSPKTLELIIKKNNVRPDGQSEATLVAVARDESGTPIPHVPIKITSNSATAVLKIGEVKNNLFIQGDTGTTGTLELSVTNVVEESVLINASASNADDPTTPLSNSKAITFSKEEATSGAPPVAKIELDQPINNNQLANGENVVSLRGKALDQTGNPVPNAKVSLILSGGSAKIKDSTEETDSSGRFFASLTDDVVEEFKVKAVLGEVSSNEVTVKFVALPPAEGKAPPTPPQSITLIASPTQQMIDSGTGENVIKLIASVRDGNNTPMAGVKVSISAKSSTALFDAGQQITGDGGTATFQVIDSVAENVIITASAWVEDEAGHIVGTAVSTSKTVTFTSTPPAETLNVSRLVVTVVKDRQPASVETPIKIDVVARDSKGVAAKDVPILILMGSSKAIARPALGKTDDNGYFSTEITSSEAGKVNVTIAVENTSIMESVNIEFVAQSGDTKRVDLEVLNNAQPADGESKITLVVVPRDATGSPLAGVDVQLISDAAHAEFENKEGTTDALGEFRTTVTNTAPETFSVTPVAVGSSGNIIGTKKSITFTEVGSSVAELVINVLKDNQPATGKDEDAIQIDVIARDKQRSALSNIPIIVQLGKDSKAIAKSEQELTDKNGLFTTKIVSTVQGSVAVTISAKGSPLIYPPVIVTFVAAPGVTKPTTVETRPAGTLSQVADGKSQIILVVTPKNGNNIMPGVDVDLITDSTTAVIDPKPPQKTNALGEVRFAIADTVAHTVTVTPIAEGIQGALTTLTFTPLGSNVTDLVVTPINNEVSANGKDTIDINVIARDARGQAVPNAPIIVQLPQKDSVAVVSPFRGTTDANTGVFSTKVTSSVAGEVPINFSIENTQITKQITVKFVPAKQSVTPVTVEIAEVRNAPQPADGKSEITLKVIPRSPTGEPIPDINIELISDPRQTVIKEPTGKTNALGEYQTTLTSAIAGTFNITPIAWKEGGEKITGRPTAITFTPIGIQVANLEVKIVNDKQPATGADAEAIQLNIIARDNGGRSVAGVPIVVQLPTGTAAIAKPGSGTTDENGLFSIKIISTVPGEVAVTVAIKDTSIAHPPVIITFVAPAGITPTTVELLVLNAPQPANGEAKITLVAIPRDAKGMPVAGVKIELIHDSNTAKLEKGSDTTNALGEFRTTVTDTVAETFKVTPIAASGAIIGTPVPITFTPIAIPIPATLTLTVEYEAGEEGRQVGKQAVLTAFAYDENHAPLNGVPVTISVQPGNEASDLSYTTVKFDPSASGSTGNADGKGGNGTFTTQISNSQQGAFKVVAKVTGTSLTSNVVDISFNAAKTTTPDVKEINLISDYPQLGTDNKNAGGTEGVLITAILKDKDNNLVQGANVRFSADSGEIQAVEIQESKSTPGVTDVSGRAQARLTTKGNRHNRVITVTAKVSTATGDKTATIPIKVTGTKIRVEGGNSLILGGTLDLTITLVDAGNLAINGEALNVTSSLGNLLSNPTPVTNASGQAVVTLTGKVPGDDIITANLSSDQDGATSGTHTVTISDHEFSIVQVPANADILRIPLNTPQQFIIRWKKGGVPQALQQISLSTTRGELPATVTTDINGEALFTITSQSAGPSQMRAATSIAGGPSAQLNINFVASSVANMTLQAEPSSIGVNTPGAGQEVALQQSKITAVLRDSNNNLVEGRTVNFNLVDNTGGDLSPISTTTDKFGQASTTYTAGGSPSASNGISIIAIVEGEPNVECRGSEKIGNGCAVKLTVALKRVFISIGAGNQIVSQDSVTYLYPLKALATDINGAPIPDTEIVVSVIPLGYAKGYYTGGESGWNPQITAPKSSPFYCLNEDVNSNGLLEPEEDRNQNGRLDPGGVVTFAPNETSVVKDNTVKVKTGSDGFATFNLAYFKELANWIVVKVVARSSVSGSEDSAFYVATLTGAADDFNDPKKSPPGRSYPNGFGSPFGLGPLDKKADGSLDDTRASCDIAE